MNLARTLCPECEFRMEQVCCLSTVRGHIFCHCILSCTTSREKSKENT